MANHSHSGLPYIGSKISLITTSDIRYEGILFTLNQEESTIAVQNVRSFGTEGRKFPEVPMSNEIYDFIIFRGKDLKDLTVLQQEPAPQQAPEDPMMNNNVAGYGMGSQPDSMRGSEPMRNRQERLRDESGTQNAAQYGQNQQWNQPGAMFPHFDCGNSAAHVADTDARVTMWMCMPNPPM